MKPEFKITRTNEFATLNIAGDLTVQFCDEFKKQLLQFSNEDIGLRLSLALVTCMDVSSIQLVYAFKSIAKLNQKELSIIFPMNADASELLIRTGMMKILADVSPTMNIN
jgi:ABC-type transporter Mla MlaB component